MADTICSVLVRSQNASASTPRGCLATVTESAREGCVSAARQRNAQPSEHAMASAVRGHAYWRSWAYSCTTAKQPACGPSFHAQHDRSRALRGRRSCPFDGARRGDCPVVTCREEALHVATRTRSEKPRHQHVLCGHTHARQAWVARPSPQQSQEVRWYAASLMPLRRCSAW